MKLDMDIITSACQPGGASVLTVVTELSPAAGPHAGVAPPRYVRGADPTYSFETRYVDLAGEGPRPVSCVLLDSKGSALNRVESALAGAMDDGVEPLSATPHIRLKYDNGPELSCLQLPHRAFDGHIRSGSVDEEPATAHTRYQAARNASPGNARALLELSPISLVLGSWDSTRKSHQARFRSALVGEVIGVLADQGPNGRDIDPRGAARFDEVAPSVRLSGADMQSVLDAQRDWLSSKAITKIEDAIKRAKSSGTVSGSRIGLGSIPPTLDALGMVSCQQIIRSHVLSFSTLRQLRFGLDPDGNATCRALLATLALSGLVRSYAELVLRANCDLVEAKAPLVTLDARNGKRHNVGLPSIEESDALLSQAIADARESGIQWEGQVLEVTGNPLVTSGIDSDEEGD